MNLERWPVGALSWFPTFSTLSIISLFLILMAEAGVQSFFFSFPMYLDVDFTSFINFSIDLVAMVIGGLSSRIANFQGTRSLLWVSECSLILMASRAPSSLRDLHPLADLLVH